MEIHRVNKIGAYTAIGILFLSCFIFITRLLGFPKAEYYLGLVLIIALIPLFYNDCAFSVSKGNNRLINSKSSLSLVNVRVLPSRVNLKVLTGYLMFFAS